MSVASQPAPSQIVPTKIGEILGSCQFRAFFWLGLSSQYLRPWQTWARKKRALFKKRETLSKSCTIKNFMAKTLDRKKIVLLLCRTDSRIGGGSPRDPFFPGKSHSLQSLALFWPKKWGFMQKCSQQRSCHMQQLQRPPHPQPHPGPHPGPPHPHYPVEWKDVVVWSSSSRGRFEKAAGLDSIHIWENERERERERVRKGLREGERVVRKPIMLSLLMIFSSRSFVLSVA